MSENGKVSLQIPAPLRGYAGGQASVRLNGTTVGEAMLNLVEAYPTLRKHLYDQEGTLRSFVNLYLNGEDVRHLAGVDTPLSPGDKLTLIPAIAGG
jgi:molybdopterin converting factor small subunit